MDDQERNLAIGAVGSALGGYAIYRSVKSAFQETASHFNNDLRHQVGNACGEEISMNGWHDLVRTNTWLKYRPSLPKMGFLDILKKLWSPSAMYYVGAAVAGFSLDLFIISILSDYPDDIRDPGINLTIGSTFALGWIGRFWLFRGIMDGFVRADSLHPGHPICKEVHRINQANASTSEITLSISEPELVNESKILESPQIQRVRHRTNAATSIHNLRNLPVRTGNASTGRTTIMGAARLYALRVRFIPFAYQRTF